MKNKFHTSIATVLAGFALTCSAAAVQAATITVEPLNSTVFTETTFDIAVVGHDFTAGDGGTGGGGFSIAWDPSLLNLDSYDLTFAGDQVLGQPGVLDNVAGTLLNADVSSLFTVVTDTDFEIAVLHFSSLTNLGVSPLDLSIGLFDNGFERIWADSSGFVDAKPSFADGSVEVIPVPAAVWLFGSGLLGLIGVARRRNAM